MWKKKSCLFSSKKSKTTNCSKIAFIIWGVSFNLKQTCQSSRQIIRQVCNLMKLPCKLKVLIWDICMSENRCLYFRNGDSSVEFDKSIRPPKMTRFFDTEIFEKVKVMTLVMTVSTSAKHVHAWSHDPPKNPTCTNTRTCNMKRQWNFINDNDDTLRKIAPDSQLKRAMMLNIPAATLTGPWRQQCWSHLQHYITRQLSPKNHDHVFSWKSVNEGVEKKCCLM